jgi:hypothetical protein
MSFMLKRGSSFSELSNIRKRLPGPDEIFREGYVYRKTVTLMVPTWARNFCILQHGELCFQSTWDMLKDDTSPLFSYKVTAQTKVVAVPKKPTAFSVETPDQPALQMSCESEEESLAWRYMIALEAKKQGGLEVYPPPVRARFFEGLLFKTPPEADRWEERWFELSSEGELSYWQSAGNSKRGVIDLETCKVVPNKTDAPGICTPFFFQIHTFVKEPNSDNYRRRIFNLSAPTQADYLNWLRALKAWIGVKRPPLVYLEDKEMFHTMEANLPL